MENPVTQLHQVLSTYVANEAEFGSAMEKSVYANFCKFFKLCIFQFFPSLQRVAGHGERDQLSRHANSVDLCYFPTQA